MSAAGESAPALAVLVPISVVLQGQRVDVAVPGNVPVAELLPGMVATLGRLNAETATQGFRAILPSGRELDQARSLTDQDVAAGAVLTLEVAGTASGDTRYDDLVEAIGVAVDDRRTAWRRGDSVQLSAYSAAGLFVVAAALLLLGGDPLLVAALAAIGAVLVVLAAATLSRLDVVGGAVALALTASVLTGVAGYGIATWLSRPLGLLGGAVGLLVGCAATAVLPVRWRSVAAGPAVLGGSLLAFGLLATFGGLPTQRAAAAVLATVTVLVLLAPWLGLARVPARIDALELTPRSTIEVDEVRRQVMNADVSTLAVRIAAGVVTTALAPLVAVDLPGLLLAFAVGLAAMLGTRSLHGRAEVLAGVIGGMFTVLAAGVSIALTEPDLVGWLAAAVIVVGAVVLAWNVVDARLRPWLNRLADGLQVVALMAVPPLTVWIFGLA